MRPWIWSGQSRPRRKAVALILLDVDYFKGFNDNYGHQAGDECLQKLATVFMNHARRAGDVAARYGGEEFCMICPYTEKNKAKLLAHSIHEKVLELQLPYDSSPFGVVTVSIGYAAAIPDGQHTFKDLLHAADEAMYQAKSTGRNCVREATAFAGVPFLDEGLIHCRAFVCF